MKTTINKEGVLSIQAESELESFALKNWCDINKHDFNYDNLKLNFNIYNPECTGETREKETIKEKEDRRQLLHLLRMFMAKL